MPDPLTDREALIAGIAADPDNDLRRLVFADWLEENGEPERAEFVRLQVESERRWNPPESVPIDNRVKELVRVHAVRWFGPFLEALNPPRRIEEYRFESIAGRYLEITRPNGPREGPYFRVAFSKGLVRSVWLDLASGQALPLLGKAFRLEPVTSAFLYLPADKTVWEQVAVPEFRYVQHLSIIEWEVGDRADLFTDEHLAGLRSLSLSTNGRDGPPQVTPAATIRRLVHSRVAGQLTNFSLWLDDDGLQAFSSRGELAVKWLSLGNGRVSARGVRAFVGSAIGRTVESLKMYFVLDEDALLALSSGTEFHRLRELTLDLRGVTERGIRALAQADFIPRLDFLALNVQPVESEHSWEDLPLEILRPLADIRTSGSLKIGVRGWGDGEPPDYLQNLPGVTVWMWGWS